MLQALTGNKAHFISLLAKAARIQRDALLDNVKEEDLGEPKPARGEHNPTAALGFEPLPPEAEQLRLLQDTIVALTPEARGELYALMRLGQGDLAAKDWARGLAQADAMEDVLVTSALLEDADLHDHLAKGLYELGLA